MYLEHFGLSAPPFQFTASPEVLFMSGTHREGLAAIEWGLLHEPSGLTLLAGDTGVGKTTLACAALARRYKQVRAAYLGNARLSFEDLLGNAMNQLGVRGGRGNKAAMIKALSNFSATALAEERIAILIDEAQGLSNDTLEDFRLLSNMDCGNRKAVQLILVGQLELARRLAAPEMRQLNERIGARAILIPLTALESRQYIESRLKHCGSASKKVFESRALRRIVKQGRGVPRRINALCHNAMLLAYSTRTPRVTTTMVKSVVEDYDGLHRIEQGSRTKVAWVRPGGRLLRWALAIGIVAIIGFTAGSVVLGYHPEGNLRSVLQHATPMADGKTVGAAIDPGVGTSAAGAATQRPDAEALRSPSGIAPSGKGASISRIATSIVGVDDSEPTSRPLHRFVVVAHGDTLGAIALRYLGSTDSIDDLLRINPQIANPSQLYPGEQIDLPTMSSSENLE
jgi:general secretion pathway protein A